MPEEPQGKRIGRVYCVKVIQSLSEPARTQTRPDQLRQENVWNASQPVAREKLAANLDLCLAKLVDPTDQRRMRYAEIPRKLLPGDRNGHVLHQGKEEFVELAFHRSA